MNDLYKNQMPQDIHECLYVLDLFQIHNYSGNARVVVTLVTDEPVPRPHAHKLVGKHCNNGVCIVQLKPGQREIQ